MNERMLELAKQAGLKKEHASDREYIGDFDWRQFGDLIVQECIKEIQQERFKLANDLTDDYDDGFVDGMGRAEHMLKKQFGVT